MTATAESHPTSTPGPIPAELVARLRQAFEGGRTRDPAWRAAQLDGLVRMLEAHESDFLQALEADLGKPQTEGWAHEIGYVIKHARWFKRRLRRLMRPRRVSTPMAVMPGRSWVQAEPLGVVLVMSAWNYPLQLALAPLVTALAAGNAALVKPSEIAPATAAALSRRIPEYLDGDAVAVFEGGVPETTALLKERFDHIVYTGGAEVARIVMRAAAEHLTPVTLELGGKSPCVVMPGADLETAARRIAWGRFINAGQTCVAPDYILTDAETEARLVPLLEKNIREMFGDDPSRSDSYGRIVNQRHFERIRGLLGSGEVAIGGDVDADRGYIAPTVLTDVSTDDPAMQQEIFGPVLPIVRAESLDAATRFIAAGEKPLAAYLFTNRAADERQFLAEVASGNACINDVVLFMAVPELPFGGVGESGMGQYKGEDGFRRLSHERAVLRRGTWPDIRLRYAPYTDKALRWLKRIG